MNDTSKSRRLISRLSEVVLSLGIPAVAYIASNGNPDIREIIPRIILILFGAWHVIAVNDEAFASHIPPLKILVTKKHAFPKWTAPSLLLVLIPLFPVTATIILFTIISWDVYSLFGKCDYRGSLAFNFIGGASHYLIGLACASNTSFARFAEITCENTPEIVFFALAMTSGAMHHESFDATEDADAGYATGAVKFSPDLWWRLGAFPLALAIFPLLATSQPFKYCFLAATTAYFASYAIFSFYHHPSRKQRFRLICRTAFVMAAAIFAYCKIVSI